MEARKLQVFVAEALEGRELLSTYYVATSGSDANPGTVAKPFKTIQRGADVGVAGDVVLVRAGVYRETVRVKHSCKRA